jgi:hypothetical protein
MPRKAAINPTDPSAAKLPFDPVQLKLEYVCGNETLQQLAARTKIPETTLEYHCREGLWVAARREFRRKRDEGLTEFYLNYQTETARALDARIARIAAALMRSVERRALSGEDLTVSELAQLTATLKTLWPLCRLSSGYPVAKEEAPPIQPGPNDTFVINHLDPTGEVQSEEV